MIGDFISARDRIISASIDIISDAGLESLTIPIISMRTNINEMMIYKYFSDTDEILEEIVATYFRFDKSVFKSIEAQNDTYLDMISAYVNQYGTYYDSYYSLSAIMLQYEELLHNTHTRETIQVTLPELSHKQNSQTILQTQTLRTDKTIDISD